MEITAAGRNALAVLGITLMLARTLTRTTTRIIRPAWYAAR